MIINFQQGIVTYPSVGSTQVFLSRSGNYVTLSTDNGRVDVTFSHGPENYFHTEADTVSNAWGPLDTSTDYWLYWDIDLRTAQRTFGVTTVQPVYSPSQPLGVENLHWFNSTTKKMNVFSNGRFRECLRVFAAKVNNATFTPLGTVPGSPFAGSQAGLTVTDVFAGRILIDTTGKPIKRADGTLFTSESKFFFNGTPINTVRLESSVTLATASQNIANFQVVALSDFEEVRVATYEDLQSAAIALCLTSGLTGQVVELCVQGMVTNPAWSWTEVGASLWVNDTGDLTSTDPHVTDPILHPEGKPPVARVFSETSIYFDQGLGGKGEPGRAVVTNVVPASTSVLGTTRLSIPPVDPSQPIAVGTNDPRMTNARTPTAHTHDASAVTTTPVGTLTGTTLDAQLTELQTQVEAKAATVVELDDVQLTSLQDNQTLRYSSGLAKWINITPAPPPVNFSELLDVALSSPQDTQTIQFNGTTNKWENVPFPTPAPSSSSFSKSIVWQQDVSVNLWHVIHNMDNLYPVVTVFDSTGAMINPANLSIIVVDNNNITIGTQDETAFTGRAHIVFADPATLVVVAPPPPPPTTSSLLDHFNGTTGTTLNLHPLDVGGNWVSGIYRNESSLVLNSGNATLASFVNGTNHDAWATQQMSALNYYVEADITMPTNAGRNQFIIYGRIQNQPVAGTTSTFSFTDVVMDIWPALNQIRVCDNGNGSTVTSVGLPAFVANSTHTFRVEFNGMLGTVKLDGVTKLTFNMLPVVNAVAGWAGFGLHFYDTDGTGPGILVNEFRAGLLP